MTPLRTRATRWLTTGWVLALSGCFVLLPPPPDDKIVECEDSADCPAGYKCVQVGAVDGLDLEKVCIQSDTEDTKPPQVDLEELDPAFAGEGAVVSIGLYVQDEVELYTEPLLEVCPPDVPGEPNDCLAPTLVEVTPLDPDAAAEGQVGRSYYYELTIVPGLREGTWTLEAIAADDNGNTTGELLVGSLEVDVTPPVVLGVAALDPTSARADEQVSLAIRFDRPVLRGPATELFGFVDGEPVGALDIGAFTPPANEEDEVEAVTILSLTTRTPLSNTVGELTFSIAGVVDQAGNVSGEQVIPGGAITLDAEIPVVVGGLEVNGDRFSSQPGHNVIELSAAFSEPVQGAWARTTTVLDNGETLSFACDLASDGLSVDCSTTVPAGLASPPGTAPTTAILYIRAADAAGNEVNEGVEVALDFAPPAIVSMPVEIEIETADGALLSEPEQAGVDTTVEVAFLLDERTGETPVVSLHTSPPAPAATMLTFVEAERTGLSFLFAAPVIAPTPGESAQLEGEGTLQIVLVDEVGNAATYSAAATLPPGDAVFALDTGGPLVVDITPPPAPRVGDLDAVVFKRIPWGAMGTDGAPRLLIEGRTTGGLPPVEVNAAGTFVRALASADAPVELGRVRTTNGTFFDDGMGGAALELPALDRNEVFVQTIDAAGNHSPAVQVRDVEWTASMGGKIAGLSLSNPHAFRTRTWDMGGIEEPSDIEVGAFAGPAPAIPTVLRTSTSPRWEDRSASVSADRDGPRSNLVVDPFSGELFGWYPRSSDEAGPVEFRFGVTRWQTAAAEAAEGQLPPTGRYLAWDGARERMVLLVSSGTWELGPAGWRQVASSLVAGEHPGLSPSGLVFHHGLGQLVTWDYDRLLAFDGEAWAELPLTGGPSARTHAGLVYDSHRQRLILLGGSGQLDVWELDENLVWDPRGSFAFPSGPELLQQMGFGPLALAYDADSGRTWFVETTWVFDSGISFEVPTDYRLWEWTGDGWLLLSTFTSRPGRMGDAASVGFRGPGELAMLGGSWQVPISPYEERDLIDRRVTATSVTPLRWQTEPAPRSYMLAAPDGDGGVLLFGGSREIASGDFIEVFEYTDTRRLAGRDLVTLVGEGGAGTSSPSFRYDPAMAWDAARGEHVLFGGETFAGDSAVTWTFDGVGWSRAYEGPADDVVAPAPRRGPQMAFDAGRGEVVLFGGAQDATYRGDTWGWDGSSWSLIASEDVDGLTAPRPRTGALMAYDAARGEVLLFGGYGPVGMSNALLNDTWRLVEGAWVEVTEGPQPPERTYGAMAYHPADRRVYLTGGALGGTVNLGDLWVFAGEAWEQTTPQAGLDDPLPAPRKGTGLAYSGEDDALLMFGGRSFEGDTGELWTLRAPTDARPAHVMEVLVASAAAGRNAVYRQVTVAGRVGGSGSAGPDCAVVDGADIDVWAMDRWRPVARGEASATLPLELAGGLGGGDAIAAISDALAERLVVRVRPSSPSGCAAARGTVATDTLEVGVRYTLPVASCGDGVLDDGEACDGDEQCGGLCRPIVCGDGVREGAEACDDANTVEGDGCSSTCVVESRQPVAGEVLISEILAAPAVSDDVDGEWIEVHNLTDRELDLYGVEVEATGWPVTVIDRRTLLPPRGVAVLGRSEDPSLNGDAVVSIPLPGLAAGELADAGGTVTLRRDGVEIDSMGWGAATSGVAVQVRPDVIDAATSAAANDVAEALCDAPERFGEGDHGSPGRKNPRCP